MNDVMGDVVAITVASVVVGESNGAWLLVALFVHKWLTKVFGGGGGDGGGVDTAVVDGLTHSCNVPNDNFQVCLHDRRCSLTDKRRSSSNVTHRGQKQKGILASPW